MKDRFSSGVRWSAVTLSGCVSCAVVAHFVETVPAFITVFTLSVIFSVLGGLTISDDA